MLRFLVSLFLCLFCCIGFAQDCQPRLSPEQAFLQLKGQASLPKAQPLMVERKLININTATEAQLTQLHGVGANKAKAIILYREYISPFHSVDDLTRVKGIGRGIMEKNRHLITVSP